MIYLQITRGAPDDRDFHQRRVARLLFGRAREQVDHLLAKVLEPLTVLSTDHVRLTADAQLVERFNLPVESGAFRLIHHEEHGHVRSAQKVRDHLVGRSQAIPHVHHEQNEVGALERYIHLGFDVRTEVVAIHDSKSTGVDNLDPAIPFLDG